MAQLRVSSVNVNGIRAAVRNGIQTWLADAGIDILTLQEVRAEDSHLAEALPGWHLLHDQAAAKGRAGVAIASRVPALAVRRGIVGLEEETKGRWIEADFDINGKILTVVSAYVHTGEAETPTKQDPKWAMLEGMERRLPELAAHSALAVVTGDLNVGHRELDIKNWRGNRKKAGFLPRERAFFDRYVGPLDQTVTCNDATTGTGLGWVDVGRAWAGEVDGPYTWWSFRGQAFDNDAGWRIDYHLATPALAATVRNYRVERAATYDARWSDHAPVTVDYEL